MKIPNFIKEYFKLDDNKTKYLDYIWTLQEFNLLEHDEKSDSYTFKPQEELDEFIEKYRDKKTIISQENKKITKICVCCHNSLSISNFYKSSDTEDGFSEKCKECVDKINAAEALTEIQKFVQIDDSFNKDELSKRIENPSMIDSYIWTLQEHDLIEYDEKSDFYRINENKILDYVQFLPKKPSIKEDKGEIKSKESSEIRDTAVASEINAQLCKKEIIYISDNNGGSTRNLILKGLIRKEEIFTTIQGLDSIIMDQNKILISKLNDKLADIIMELEVDSESLENVINLLKDAEWDNRVILNNTKDVVKEV